MGARLAFRHPWDVSAGEACDLQRRLGQCVCVRPLEGAPRSVGGVDVSVKGRTARAAAVLLSYPGLVPLQAATAEVPVTFPYVPGLLAFREGPAVLAALDRLRRLPDVLLFDAQGVAHPRRLGLAAHLGVLLDRPAIGCAKSRLCGSHAEPGEEKGSWTPLTDGDEVIGAVVRTRSRVRPLFVSVGHRVDLESAVALVLGCAARYRLPEPTRWAHRVAGGKSCLLAAEGPGVVSEAGLGGDERIAESVRRVAALLRRARHAVALTGAGMSTRSGIPDFRSPGTGLWEQVDPFEVASIQGFRRRPEAFYAWVRPLLATHLAAEPNPGHLALAEMEAGGWLKGVITQNIDGLHQRAGSQEVLEMHGHLRQAACMACHRVVALEGLLDVFFESGQVPRCPACGGVMKPAVVFYGELLPGEVWEAAMAHVQRADVMLVAGSSLETVPVSQFPEQVHRRGGHLVVVNLALTHIDGVAEVVVHDDVADVLPRVAQACKGVDGE